MKKINGKKLGLATETVRNLDVKPLEEVRGGMMNNTFLCPVTTRCTPQCTYTTI